MSHLDIASTSEREARQRLYRFVADASHELRTPLTALRGYAELYRAGGLEDPDDLGNAMRRIGLESGRMQQLIDDLLLLARLNRDPTLDPSHVDLVVVTRDAIRDSQAIEPDQPIIYQGPTVATVQGDRTLLTQAIAKLLANARQHSPDEPVTVTITQRTGEVCVEVDDLGPPIAETHQDQLFNRYQRAEPSPAQQTRTTGLALSIVAAIVDTHHGTMSAAHHPERGARFTITLPKTSTHSDLVEPCG